MTLNFKKLSAGKLIIVLNMVALVLLAGLFWLLLDEIKSERVAQAELVPLEREAGKLLGNKQLLSSTKNDQAKIETYFVSAQTLPDLIENLEKVALETGVKLELNQAFTDKTKLKFDLSVSGSFKQVTNYLALLQTLPYQLSFTSTRLNQWVRGEKERISSWRLQTSIELLSYRENQN